MLRRTGASVVLLAALLSAGPARATDPRTEAAREHSTQGDAYYKLEKYGNAIGEYEQAYLSKTDPSFLYNIAQCHRLMGHGAEAIKFYRRFLKDAPNAPNRAVAEKHIRDLEESSAHPGAAGVVTAPPSPPPSVGVPATAPPPATATKSTAPSTQPSAPPPPTSTTPPPVLALSPPPPTSSPVSETTTQMAPIGENAVPPSQTESHPIYTRWWFWTAVGVVVVGGIVIAAAAARDPSCPGGYRCN